VEKKIQIKRYNFLIHEKPGAKFTKHSSGKFVKFSKLSDASMKQSFMKIINLSFYSR